MPNLSKSAVLNDIVDIYFIENRNREKHPETDSFMWNINSKHVFKYAREITYVKTKLGRYCCLHTADITVSKSTPN